MGDDHGPSVGEEFKYSTGLTTAGKEAFQKRALWGEPGRKRKICERLLSPQFAARRRCRTFIPLSFLLLTLDCLLSLSHSQFTPLSLPPQRPPRSSSSMAAMSLWRRSSPSKFSGGVFFWRKEKKEEHELEDARKSRLFSNPDPTSSSGLDPPLFPSPRILSSPLSLYLSPLGCSSTSSCSLCRCPS